MRTLNIILLTITFFAFSYLMISAYTIVDQYYPMFKFICLAPLLFVVAFLVFTFFDMIVK